MREYTIIQDGVTLVIKVIEDLIVPGSFQNDAASDQDYYGYRETYWEVEYALDGRNSLGEYEINEIIMKYDDEITKKLQLLIDNEV